MTNEVTLSLDGVSVDLTQCGVKVTHRISNPIITIDTPRDDLLVSNTIGINIGFVSENVDLNFTLTDGIGTLNWAVPTTNYEKLFYFCYKLNPKVLTINGRVIYGHIENLTLPFESGKSNLSIGGSLSFRVTQNIEMEPSGFTDGWTVLFTNASPLITLNAASSLFGLGQTLEFTTTGTLPTNFDEGTTYYALGVNTTQFAVSASLGGSLIYAGSAGSGTHKVKRI